MSANIFNNSIDQSDSNQDSDIFLVKEEPAPASQQIIPIEFPGDHQVVNTSDGQAIVLTLDHETLSALTGGKSQGATMTTTSSNSSQAQVISPSKTINSSDRNAKWPYVRRARRSGIAPDGSCVNQYGRHFANGRPLPENLRLEILKAYDRGVRPSQISRTLQVSHGCVSKILNKYRRNAFLTSEGQREYPTRATPLSVVHKIREIKRELPHLVAWEIRLKLITDNICPPDKAPSISCITRILREYSINSNREKMQVVSEQVVSSNVPTTISDSQSDLSLMQNWSSQLSPTLNNDEAIIQQQKQQILTLLQDPLKNSMNSKTTTLDNSNNLMNLSERAASSNIKSDESIYNPLAGLNASALITALLTLSGQPCGNPWEPLWMNQEHLLMTSNGAAMKQIVYMGNNLWKLKCDDEEDLYSTEQHFVCNNKKF